MKPRTTLERKVMVVNEHLSSIDPKAIDWANDTLIPHYMFRTSGHNATCGDCGYKFDFKGNKKSTICPNCGRRIEVCDTRKRIITCGRYFAVLEAVDGIQVERVFRLTNTYRKYSPCEHSCDEICRLWLDAKGHTAVTSRRRPAFPHCMDSFLLSSPIKLTSLNDIHLWTADSLVYPKYSVIPELKRNGMKGKIPFCSPFILMRSLLSDPRYETLMKKGYKHYVEYFINNPASLDNCWASLKVAMRHGYDISDLGIWRDLINLLVKSGKDIHNPKYICPTDLRGEHDRWFLKSETKKEKEERTKKLLEAKQRENDFLNAKSRYFDISIDDDDINVIVLDSIEAYQEEGMHLHHCVFKCAYYDKSDSLILSARDKQGNRIETIEFSLSTFQVVQSRGLYNKNSSLHDRIINLVNSNAGLFIEAKASA